MESLLASSIQFLKENLIVEMNIGQDFAMQKFQCCGAANHNAHSSSKKRLTIRRGSGADPPKPAAFRSLTK
jgi:hypothetical protein